VRIARKTREARDVCSFELVAVDGGALPPFTAGAHIDVHLDSGLVRQYSLCNHRARPIAT
jgi:vanillate O-demethylase ferredoxin subunit